MPYRLTPDNPPPHLSPWIKEFDLDWSLMCEKLLRLQLSCISQEGTEPSLSTSSNNMERIAEYYDLPLWALLALSGNQQAFEKFCNESEVNIPLLRTEKNLLSIAHFIAWSGCDALIDRFFRAHPASCTITDCHGRVAFHYALLSGDESSCLSIQFYHLLYGFAPAPKQDDHGFHLAHFAELDGNRILFDRYHAQAVEAGWTDDSTEQVSPPLAALSGQLEMQDKAKAASLASASTDGPAAPMTKKAPHHTGLPSKRTDEDQARAMLPAPRVAAQATLRLPSTIQTPYRLNPDSPPSDINAWVREFKLDWSLMCRKITCLHLCSIWQPGTDLVLLAEKVHGNSMGRFAGHCDLPLWALLALSGNQQALEKFCNEQDRDMHSLRTGESLGVAHFVAWSGCNHFVQNFFDAHPESCMLMDCFGRSPYHYALLSGDEASCLSIRFHYLCNGFTLAPGRDAYGFHFIHYAVLGGNPTLFDWYYNEVSQTGLTGGSIGHTLAQLAALSGKLNMLEKVVCLPPVPMPALNLQDPDTQAALARDTQFLKTLFPDTPDDTILKAPELSHQDTTFEVANPIHFAIWINSEACLTYLVKIHGFSTDPTYIDETLLHHAAWTGNVAMMQYIQSTYPQNAHAQDIYGRSVLHFAAASGNPSALDFVIETYRLDPKACDKKGRSALHYAILSGVPGCIELLISKYGLSPDDKDTDQLSTRDYAKFSTQLPVVDLFFSEKGTQKIKTWQQQYTKCMSENRSTTQTRLTTKKQPPQCHAQLFHPVFYSVGPDPTAVFCPDLIK